MVLVLVNDMVGGFLVCVGVGGNVIVIFSGMLL